MPHVSMVRANRAPSHWPSDVEYLRTMVYTPCLPPNVLLHIRGKGSPARLVSESRVIIRRIDSETHPAYGQHGLFASKKIPPGTHIVDYFGEVHMDEREDSDYDLSLYRTYEDGGVIINVGIDATRMGNEARFVNDYRGVRPKPNAVFKERRIEAGELRMSIWSGNTEAIDKGNEILVSYGKAWWRARQNSN